MSIIKIASGYAIRSGKHGGQCFQQSLAGPTIKNNAHVRRWRSAPQRYARQFELRCMQQWKYLSVAEQTNWENWVAAYPQPTLLDPLVSLTAYENFIKRNYYRYLANPATFTFMTSPNIVEYSQDYLTPVITVSDVAIFLDCSFDLGDNNQDCLIFVSNPLSPGRNFGNTFWRFMACVSNVNQSIDITDMYLANFGILPEIGQTLFISVVFAGKDNGQFTFHHLIKIVVKPPAPPVWEVEYGALYNGYAIDDARGLAAPGSHIISNLELDSLISYTGGAAVAGGRLKETGLVYFNSPNTGASNMYSFFGRGNGFRNNTTGVFSSLKNLSYIFTSYTAFGTLKYYGLLRNDSAAISAAYTSLKLGAATRIVKDSTTLSDGESGTYTQNDGKIIETICIDGVEFLEYNLCETKFANGDWIPGFEGGSYNPVSDTDWENLTSSAMCVYDDLLVNAPL